MRRIGVARTRKDIRCIDPGGLYVEAGFISGFHAIRPCFQPEWTRTYAALVPPSSIRFAPTTRTSPTLKIVSPSGRGDASVRDSPTGFSATKIDPASPVRSNPNGYSPLSGRMNSTAPCVRSGSFACRT